VTDCVAVINASPSDIKFALYAEGDEGELLFRGWVEELSAAPRLSVMDASGASVVTREWAPGEIGHREATNIILRTSLELLDGRKACGVGHRVTHGGTTYRAPVVIGPQVMRELARLSPLAPRHQPNNLVAIDAIAAAAPELPQVACFDTAFHCNQPEAAQLFALPEELTDEGIRRYGFHGLSYEYVTRRLMQVAPWLSGGRVIAAHLGNEASLCALKRGCSQATTTGFSAVEGLIMSTRCGSIDPGVLLYLMDQHGMDARAIEELLCKKSGLLGVSGISADMRELKEANERSAAMAIDLFVYRIVREIGSLAAALGGLDGIVFTGGIGENDDQLRRRVCEGCSWLGVEEIESGGSGERKISGAGAAVEVWVIPTDEERMVAQHTNELLFG